jgi:catechol 2,3-dioxygenase-like lactoylglutathione lyase family enzyme
MKDENYGGGLNMIESISHLTFMVKDLAQAARFFEYIFDAEEIYSSGDRTFSISREKYLLICRQWVCIMEGDPISERTYNHVAFKIPDEEFEDYEARVRTLGLDIKQPRPRIEGEGRSLYFYDFDNHLFELHTGTLAQRLDCYAQ